MPQLLPALDDIAIEKQRDVLFVDFELDENNDYMNCKVRDELIKWLDEQNIAYQECFHTHDGCTLTMPYLGGLYIDVPFDLNNPTYQKLSQHLENEDGSLKIDGLTFWVLTLD